MPRIPGFKSDLQRHRFQEAAKLYVRGGPLARVCGARLRTGGTCSQLALAAEARCLRHGGPDAARRHRERQKAGLENGSVSPEEWARAEGRRARNAITWAWRKDPRLPGRTIDLGPDEASFAKSAVDMGLDVDGLYPAVADWLRWRWRRYQKDRPDAARWVRVVCEELPRKRTAADEAVAWIKLGITDKRTKAARAARAAIRAGDIGRAQAALNTLRARSSAPLDEVLGKGLDQHPGPLTSFPVQAWTARPAFEGWKRRQPDRRKPPPLPKGPPRAVGRPRRVPDSPAEIAALAEVLRTAGPVVQRMFEVVAEGERVAFLRDLAAITRAPDDARARARWLRWAAGQVATR